MTDSQRIDKLKQIILLLIDILEESTSAVEGSDLDGHNHDLFDDYDRHELNKIRSEAENI